MLPLRIGANAAQKLIGLGLVAGAALYFGVI